MSFLHKLTVNVATLPKFEEARRPNSNFFMELVSLSSYDTSSISMTDAETNHLWLSQMKNWLIIFIIGSPLTCDRNQSFVSFSDSRIDHRWQKVLLGIPAIVEVSASWYSVLIHSKTCSVTVVSCWAWRYFLATWWFPAVLLWHFEIAIAAQLLLIILCLAWIWEYMLHVCLSRRIKVVY